MQDIKELPAPESGVVSLEEQELSRSGSVAGGVGGLSMERHERANSASNVYNTTYGRAFSSRSGVPHFFHEELSSVSFLFKSSFF